MNPSGIYLKSEGEGCSYSNIEIGEGTGKHIEVAFIPANATGEKVTWSTSVSGIVSITEEANGVYIFAKKQGTTTLTATTPSGLSTLCVINVKYCMEPVLVYQAGEEFYPLDCKEIGNKKTISTNTKLYVREYIDSELTEGSRMEFWVTDMNMQSGTYRSYQINWGNGSLRQGVYAYYPVKFISSSEKGDLRIYTKVVLSNNSEWYVQQRDSEDAFYLTVTE